MPERAAMLCDGELRQSEAPRRFAPGALIRFDE